MASVPASTVPASTMALVAAPVQSELDDLADALQNGGLTLWDFGRALIILMGAALVARTARFVVRRGLARRRTDAIVIDLTGRIVGYLILMFGCLYALNTLGVAIGPLLGAMGIVGFALAFALQDVVENFVAGLILQGTRPFGADDQIETGDYEGTVIAVDARTVTLVTLEGETVRLPSAEVIKGPIVNHTTIGQRRTTVEVGVAYGTDLDHARAVTLAAVGRVPGVHAEPEPEALLVRFGASSIDLAALFWHAPEVADQWRVRNDVVAAIDRAFKAENITIPFPQRDVHLAPVDGEG